MAVYDTEVTQEMIHQQSVPIYDELLKESPIDNQTHWAFDFYTPWSKPWDKSRPTPLNMPKEKASQ